MAVPPHSIINVADQDHPIGHAVRRVLLAILAWLGSVAASDIQVWVSIIGGVGVAVYTWLNACLLWRKLRRESAALGGTD
jgi:DNA primase